MPHQPTPLPALPSLWAEVMAHFGLSQAALGRILGLRPALMNHVLTGRRSLPLAALPQLAAPLRPANAAPPAWLVQFESEARVALAGCGPVPQARLALRREYLLYRLCPFP